MSAHRRRPIGASGMVCKGKVSAKFRLSEDNVNLFTLLSARNLVQASEKANNISFFPSRSLISILQSKI